MAANVNSKLWRQWQEEAYLEWLTRRQNSLGEGLVSLAGDVHAKNICGDWDWARDARIPEILLELREVDDEIHRLTTDKEAEG